MIDGITIKYKIEDFEAWKKSHNIKLTTSVDTFDSGEIENKKRHDTITTTHRGRWETYDIKIKEVFYISKGIKVFYLVLKGSLHKNYFKGANYLPFTWLKLQEEISHLCKTLCINPSKAQISNLEIGVNIRIPFEVIPFFMNNVISYKGNSFNRYERDAARVCLGTYCGLSQYSVKIYNKGLQNKLQYNLMRFELRFLKMQRLNMRGINYLSDLQNLEKIYNLQTLLLKTWNDILIFDVTEPIKKLPIKQREIDLLINGQNSKYWERLKISSTGDRFKYLRNNFKMLVTKYGNKQHSLVHDLVANEWKNLFNNDPNLPTSQN